METLKKYFPFSFTDKKDVSDLIIRTIIYVVVAAAVGIVLGIIGKIPFVGILIHVIGTAFDLYVTATIVLMFLHYFKVIK